MTCFTEKGCERRILEPFVSYLNATEGTAYAHHRCLLSVDRKQPEELFLDAVTQSQLVIERKSIAWPDHYEYGHAKDHLVADTVFSGLKDMRFQRAYTLSLPYLIPGKKEEVRQFAVRVARLIRNHLDSVRGTRAIGSDEPHFSWRLYETPPWEFLDGAPSRGIVAIWNAASDDILIDPARLPKKLEARLARAFASCVVKFHGWRHARKILALDQLGALRHNGSDWWQKVFLSLQPPAEIDEIWLGLYDWVDDWNQGWIFEKLWGGRPKPD